MRPRESLRQALSLKPSCIQGFRGSLKSLKFSWIKFKAIKNLKWYKKVLIIISRGLMPRSRQGQKREHPSLNVPLQTSVRSSKSRHVNILTKWSRQKQKKISKMLRFVLKTADEKLRLRYHFINFTGQISDFKWCSRHYFQVGGGKNPNFELSGMQH